ncbi:MAG: hypothetical protein ACPGRX_02720 [Bdellovibrionales bacterium]
MRTSPKARQPGVTEFHLTFNTVNGNVNELIVGSYRLKTAFRKRGVTDRHQTAKAISIPFPPANAEALYTPRVEAIEQLFKKIKSGDAVEIYTSDQPLIDLANGTAPPEASEAQAQFNKVVKKFGALRVYHRNERSKPDEMAVAERLAKLRQRDLEAQSNGSKGFHRPALHR